jgi:hypothetical protein
MDGRLADQTLPPTTPLKPKLLGRGLPVPPVVVLVATVGVFIGLALGYGIAPKPSPPPASSPTTASASPVGSPLPSALPVPSITPTSEPTASAYELPPAGGLTLTEAFAALSKSGLGFSPSAVISARVERFGEVTSEAASGNPDPWVWVWAIAIRGTLFPSPCGNCPSPPMTDITTEMIILDYNTGAYLGGWGPAFP